MHLGDTGSFGTHYQLRVDGGRPYDGLYEVKASDGMMIEFHIAAQCGPVRYTG